MACVVVAVHVNGDASQTSDETPGAQAEPQFGETSGFHQRHGNTDIIPTTPHCYTHFLTSIRASFRLQHM
jgi:hypothetical protein